MSEPTLRRIWTPDDARQTAIDAAKHRAEPVWIPIHDAEPQSAADVGVGPLPTGGDASSYHYDPFYERPAGAHRAPVRGRHRTTTVLGMRPRRALRISRAALTVGVVVLVLALAALWSSSQAKAQPAGVKCADQIWIVPFQSARRTICDGPIQPDGSWQRAREFYTPAHYVRGSGYCSRYGGCSFTEGYYQERTSRGIEVYPVTPATVLADEPGHLA